MIETIDTKRAQLANGYYQNGTGPEMLLIVGSCRTLAYLNYFVRWNELNGNRFTVCRIDPFDWHWNQQDEIVDLEQAITACEQDQRILDLLSRTSIYIHEYYAYFGMFNSSKESPKNIYQFGLNPKVDICIPNFHDRFVLFSEQMQFNPYFRENIQREGIREGMRDLGLLALNKFYDVCGLSSFPEFAEEFRANWTRLRYFWTANHVSRHFTMALFRLMNEKFLHLPMTDSFLNEIGQQDQFDRPCTPVTQYDVDAYGLTWEGTIVEELKL